MKITNYIKKEAWAILTFLLMFPTLFFIHDLVEWKNSTIQADLDMTYELASNALNAFKTAEEMDEKPAGADNLRAGCRNDQVYQMLVIDYGNKAVEYCDYLGY